MITARQFKNGFIVEINKTLFQVLESQHIKPGKGGAFVRAKLRNMDTGSITDNRYRPEDAFPQAYIENKVMQFLYKDSFSSYHFMAPDTYEQIEITESAIGSTAKFLKDGMDATVSFHKERIVGVSLPSYVELKISYTEPGMRGDTAKGGSKPATTETGAIVRVPLFINTDDVIKVDTRTGEYGGRV